MLLPFFTGTFYCDSFTREEDCIQNLLCTQRTFGNYWAFAVFRGPDLIANLSDGLKIMDPGFITSDDIGKLLFVIFWKHLKQLFGHFNPLPLLLVSHCALLSRCTPWKCASFPFRVEKKYRLGVKSFGQST